MSDYCPKHDAAIPSAECSAPDCFWTDERGRPVVMIQNLISEQSLVGKILRGHPSESHEITQQRRGEAATFIVVDDMDSVEKDRHS